MVQKLLLPPYVHVLINNVEGFFVNVVTKIIAAYSWSFEVPRWGILILRDFTQIE